MARRLKIAALSFPALEIRQRPTRTLYCFAVDGARLDEIAAVSRVRRDGNLRLLGYQRAQVTSHIRAIRKYLESDETYLPNALTVAFTRNVRFSANQSQRGMIRAGTLQIPAPTPKGPPGWIVDGQQRAAAIKAAGLTGFPVFVVAFVARDEGEQRAQFILVNRVRPLPRGLINELLPSANGVLPAELRRRTVSADLLHRLNSDSDSPLKTRIRTITNPEGVIQDTSILRMIENSATDGALYGVDLRSPTGRRTALRLMKTFWSATRECFPDAWAKAPTRSRLTHGVGIVSMGYVMDTIAEQIGARASLTHWRAALKPLVPASHWTSGTWRLASGRTRRWDEFQNTGRDIEILSAYLLKQLTRRGPSR